MKRPREREAAPLALQTMFRAGARRACMRNALSSLRVAGVMMRRSQQVDAHLDRHSCSCVLETAARMFRMVYVLALTSAAVYGAADFFGGLAARRASAIAIVVVSQLAGLIALLVVLPLLPAAS